MLLLLEFAFHAFTDLVMWVAGRLFDRRIAARHIASFERGDGAAMRIRFRFRSEGPQMRRGRLTLTRTGATLTRTGESAGSIRVGTPTVAVTGAGRDGTSLLCTLEDENLELLVPTRDQALLKLVSETIARP
ncbi:hypothetical protein ACFWUW_33215 [Streptomyces sp. NPDC058655]|uniref:hypothetical protein n=1 Tax=Streptomyces sp. NPDC058655 TaxID=3346577 RepID=UPI00365B2863